MAKQAAYILTDTLGLATDTLSSGQSDSLFIMAPPAADSLPENTTQLRLLDAPDSVLMVTGRLQGESGRPLPYTMRSDNLLTGSLLVCLCLYVLFVGHYAGYLMRQVKSLLFPSFADTNASETSSDTRSLLVLCLLDFAMLALGTYLIASQYFHVRLDADSPFLFITLLTAVFTLFFLLKLGLYSLVNSVFFGKKKNLQWINFLLFITSCEGLLLLPVVILQTFFDFNIEISVIYCGFVLFLNKIVTFYKSWLNFFRQNGGFLQTFLYFCALEIITSLSFVAALCFSIDEIKINF
jgi:hypothetical protein